MSHQAYIDYFKGLAESHKELRHSKTRKAFASWNTAETSEISNAISWPLLQVFEPEGVLSGDESTVWDEISGGFVVWVKSQEVKGNYQSNDAALEVSKTIGLEIIMKLANDMEENCGPWYQIDFQRVKYRTVQLTNHFQGYAFEFPLRPINEVEHNPEVWQ